MWDHRCFGLLWLLFHKFEFPVPSKLEEPALPSAMAIGVINLFI